MNFLQAQQGLKKAGERDTLFKSMPIEDLESKIRKLEDWMTKNSKHERSGEAKSVYGHAKMIYTNRTGLKDVRQKLF